MLWCLSLSSSASLLNFTADLMLLVIGVIFFSVVLLKYSVLLILFHFIVKSLDVIFFFTLFILLRILQLWIEFFSPSALDDSQNSISAFCSSVSEFYISHMLDFSSLYSLYLYISFFWWSGTAPSHILLYHTIGVSPGV